MLSKSGVFEGFRVVLICSLIFLCRFGLWLRIIRKFRNSRMI